MRKLTRLFDDIWEKAQKRNRFEAKRFIKIFDQRKRYITMGIYDSKTKKYCLFDTINLVGNFRYSAKTVPAEFDDMQRMLDR